LYKHEHLIPRGKKNAITRKKGKKETYKKTSEKRGGENLKLEKKKGTRNDADF